LKSCQKEKRREEKRREEKRNQITYLNLFLIYAIVCGLDK